MANTYLITGDAGNLALRWLGKVPGVGILDFAFPGGRYIILP